ncbi:tRNA pseudouridine synthase A family protein, putative [Babesia bigemina]|uniref:tRNA pseudouridine synthase n=1 Tax=Babesia bigemina TaxID=5866 RepID=A0A061DAJ0_BABBI|nr:tRNA pseudouridine synthase A family protein, putative [Babesia bigemina]CDR96997.1 tRNA pseudouridine synthase A family protein, putative [Babesia bigemina]|eukprot:XP_012769183.1 tRNA pseudouridine synthase A family protein, putative [Babesia bigemina]
MSDPRFHHNSCCRKVLVDFSYIGTGFHPNTVEGHLFAAFAKAHIAANVLNNGYERCGRTDTGVHALHNYCSFFMDPCFPEDPSATTAPDSNERRVCYRINTFVKAVNKHLPRSIRVNSVQRVADDFSSRHNCVRRTYKYFFQLGAMNLPLMQEASQHFVGSHNFRQFCKQDNRNPKDPNRTIYSFTVERYSDLLCVATVRCMVGALFLVGEGSISASKIAELLQRPDEPKFQYKMASPHGLILVDCNFDMPTVPRPELLDDAIQTLGPMSLLAKCE